MGMVDYFRCKLNPDIINAFNDLVENHQEALNMYCNVRYTAPNISKVNLSRQSVPTSQSSFSTKRAFAEAKEIIIKNYSIQINYENECNFKRSITNNFLRNKYYIQFLRSVNKTNTIYYCLDHLPQLDLYIKQILLKEIEILKKKYPQAIKQLSTYAMSNEHYYSITTKSKEELCNLQSILVLTAIYNNWEKSQEEFSKQCRTLRNDLLPQWGCYHYSVPFKKYDSSGKQISGHYKVWQLFYDAYAPNDNLDYTYFVDYVKNRDINVPNLLKIKRIYKNIVYDRILNYILKVKEKYQDGSETYIYLANSGIDDPLTMNIYHFADLEEKLSEHSIKTIHYGETIPKTNSKVRIFIIELASTNKRLVSLCSDIVSQFCSTFKSLSLASSNVSSNCFVDLVFLSLNKEYDNIEMGRLIDEKGKQIQKEREEIELVNTVKKVAREYPTGFKFYYSSLEISSINKIIAKRISKHLDQIVDYENATKKIKAVVTNWDTSIIGFPYYFFYYYYPTRFTNVTPTSQRAREMIWNFKDGYNIPELMNMLKQKLKDTFGDNQEQLTLVCIPASTVESNNERYQDFSEKLCSSTGMRNAYSHIHITKEKTQSHLGGTDKAEYSFDESFFCGANVVLFDDVVTRGRSMKEFRSKLCNLGANIICAISIGRTYSDYYGDNRKPHPYTGTL